MAPRVGLEPTTNRLTAGYSTIELPGNLCDGAAAGPAHPLGDSRTIGCAAGRLEPESPPLRRLSIARGAAAVKFRPAICPAISARGAASEDRGGVGRAQPAGAAMDLVPRRNLGLCAAGRETRRAKWRCTPGSAVVAGGASISGATAPAPRDPVSGCGRGGRGRPT